MPIQKPEKMPVNGFTCVPNTYLKDRSLSLKAKGLMTLLLSLPPDWAITRNGLSEICAENKDTISSILDELTKRGYLRRCQQRNAGRFSSAIYELVFEEPRNEVVDESKTMNEISETHVGSGLALPCEKADNHAIIPLHNHCFNSVAEETVSGENGSDIVADEELGRIKYINNKIINNKILTNKSLNHSVCDARMNDGTMDYESVTAWLVNELHLDELSVKHPSKLVNSVIDLLADTIAYQSSPEVIDGKTVPAQRLKCVLRTLDYFMVDEVLENVQNASQDIMNLRAYLLTCLYRKATMSGGELDLVASRFG